MSSERRITHRSGGIGRGGITRLVSPGDLGQLIKPFVFLDRFAIEGAHRMQPHPHSGIATVTVVSEGSLYYKESTGAEGVLPQGGVEWMSAGGGVWHEGGAHDARGVSGFQLWVALPEADELSPAWSRYAAPHEIATVGPARVILGRHAGAASPIEASERLNYLHVKLSDGERWTYVPPAGHTIAWLATMHGTLRSGGVEVARQVAVFEAGEQPITIEAVGDAEFVLGSAIPHPHPLVTGYYSVHTSAQALAQGEAGIRRLGQQLAA